MTVKIAPSILSADFGRLAEQVIEAEKAGADWIHVDVMDGHFVPNLTMGPAIVKAVRKTTKMPIDVHLMIEKPERHIPAFADAGSDLITVHQETCPHLNRTIDQIQKLGRRAGVTLNPATSLVTLSEVLCSVDLVLVMSVNPGFSGQSYIGSSTDKLMRAKQLIDACKRGGIELEVDGGIDEKTTGAAVGAGATVLVAGNAVYGHPEGVAAGIRALRKAAEAAVPRTRLA